MSEYWGKQRGYEKSYGDYGMKCEHEKKECEREKCRPPRICEAKKCEFCGFVWRKCQHCGKCVCCKVFRCGDDFIFVCSECGEVFKVECEEECERK